MSFGYSIGDFIAAGDKAWLLYQKCKSAQGDYEALDGHVRILHSVLKEVHVFVSSGDVPNLQLERTSLVAARDNCSATLAELDAFLDRHAGLIDESRKRRFELAKFIAKDIQSLKNKLDHSTKLLQLSLQSLQMFSVHGIRIQLQQIRHEYRSGIREPTVVSETVIFKKRDRMKTRSIEVSKQIRADLEDKDVHPRSITLNDSFIKRWLESTLADGGLEESIDTDGGASQPDSDRSDEVECETPPATIADTSSIDPSINESPVSPIQESSEGYPTTASVYLEGEKSSLMGDVAAPPSPTESVSSHRSKPDDWRPFDTPNSVWVERMILPLFKRDPFVELAESEPDLRIKRAFHQLDYDRKGTIAEHKVWQLCASLMDSIGLFDKLKELAPQLYSADSDINGQFTETKYLKLMNMILPTVMKLRRRKILEELMCLDNRGSRTVEHCACKLQNILPWCWRPYRQRPAQGLKRFFVSHGYEALHNGEPLGFPYLRFDEMVSEASRVLREIDYFEEEWLKIVPKESQRRKDFQSPLEAARQLAYRFNFFKNPEDRHKVSDLDTLADYVQILFASGGLRDGYPFEDRFLIFSRDGAPFKASSLQYIRQYAYSDILQPLRGFVRILDQISKEIGSHKDAHYYTQLNAKLEYHKVILFGKALSIQASEWDEKVPLILPMYRRAHNRSFVNSMRTRCQYLASRYHNRLSLTQLETIRQLSRYDVVFEKVEVVEWKVPLLKNKKVDIMLYILANDRKSKTLVAETQLGFKRGEKPVWNLGEIQKSMAIQESIVLKAGYESTDTTHFELAFHLTPQIS